MVQFNDLSIYPDINKLIIDISVINDNKDVDTSIDSVIIDTQDTYCQNGPSNNPVYSYIVEENSIPVYVPSDCQKPQTVYCKDDVDNSCIVGFNDNGKYLRLTLSGKDLNVANLSNNIFFVYVNVKNTPSEDSDITATSESVIGVVFDKSTLYDISMRFLKELSCTCNIPKGFIDFILQMKALDISVETGHYIEAIHYWNKFSKYLPVN